MTVLNASIGFAEESTYGTPVTPTKFFEFNSESLKKVPGRSESKGHRAGQRVMRADRHEPYHTGVTGSLELDVPTKGFGILLKHALGTASISTATDSNYTQTHIIGDLTSRYLTGQVNRQFQAGTDQAHTFHGLKIVAMELSCDMDGVLVASFEFDGEDEDTGTALATVTYASDTRVFSWAGGAVTIGGSSAEITGFRCRIANALNTGRRYLRGSVLKKNPLENDFRTVEWELKGLDHTALTNYGRVIDLDRADNLAAIVATFNGPVAHAGTTLPRLEITLPAARFDAVDGLSVSTFDPLSTTFSGIATDDDSAEPLTITYRTTDSAVV